MTLSIRTKPHNPTLKDLSNLTQNNQTNKIFAIIYHISPYQPFTPQHQQTDPLSKIFHIHLLHLLNSNKYSPNFNKIILMSDGELETPASHLEELFNRAKPKSRYISESHVEEETSSIAKEIINGDIEVRRTRGNLDIPTEKNSYEEMLRRRYVEQIEREKQQLQHKLGYIQNSLTHLDKYDYLRKRLSQSGGDLGTSRQKSEDWRRQFEEEMKRLQEKKKEIADRAKQRQSQNQQLRNKVQEQQLARKKAQLAESVKKMKERMQKRQQKAKQQQQRVKQLLSRKELYQKLEERYQSKEEGVLQERKKKLAEIRQLKQPVSMQEILEHQQRVLEILREKEALRSQQKKMLTSRARSYRPSYQSVFYKQIAAPPEQQLKQNPKQKLQKMRQFSEQVKSKYVPDIDENKRKQMEEKLEHDAKAQQIREQKERQLREKPKLKGLQYLELVKKMPKKKDAPPTAPNTDRIQYKNYLGNISVDMGKAKPWNTILSKGEHKVETAQLLQFQSEKVEEKLRRKEQYGRALKLKDDGSIDQQYYQMVKAKLDLLAKD